MQEVTDEADETNGEEAPSTLIIGITTGERERLRTRESKISTACVGQARDRTDEQGRIFRFCKVAGRPYEDVVGACLAAFERRFGETVQVEADSPHAGLAAGRKVVERLFH